MYKHSTYIQFLQNYITKQKWTANALQVMTVITAEDGVAGFLHEDVIMVIKYCSNRRSLCSSQRLFNGFHPTATKGLVKSHQKLSQLFEISSHTQLEVKYWNVLGEQGRCTGLLHTRVCWHQDYQISIVHLPLSVSFWLCIKVVHSHITTWRNSLKVKLFLLGLPLAQFISCQVHNPIRSGVTHFAVVE